MPNRTYYRARFVAASLLFAIITCAAHLACSHQGEAAQGPATATTKAATKPTSKPVVAKWTPRAAPANEVNLILFGDFGNAKQSQKDTAKTMAAYVEKTGTQFNAALTVGDNFYVKMRDVDDWQFQSLFEDMYDARRLNFPFFVSMGNHDYELAEPRTGKTKADLEREYTARHPDSRWKALAERWYRLDFPVGSEKPLLTVLMLDSSKPKMTDAEWGSQKAWIDEQLATTPAKWKVACAHHPFFSNGSHGDNGVMQVEWGPIFKARGLDLYIAGHDHDLQHLQIEGWPISFVQAGGGGQPVTDMRRDVRGPFSRKIHGFAHLRVSGETADVRYLAIPDAKIIHEFARDKQSGAIRIVSTTGRDKATTKPLKTLAGLGEADVRAATKPTTRPDAMAATKK
jgi:hypothetical protein